VEPDDLDLRRKRLLYRASHRGFKEADLLIGGFAASAVPTMSADELAEFETLLEHPDWRICAWVLGGEAPPEDPGSPVLRRLIGARRRAG
jgi:antitoxin CptB